jgi:hypothetical protein
MECWGSKTARPGHGWSADARLIQPRVYDFTAGSSAYRVKNL